MENLWLPKLMFAAGEEPNGETVNTYHKPKRIETILEALDPEETQLVFHRLNRSCWLTQDSESESDCNDLQADEEEEPDVSKPIPLLQVVRYCINPTHI